MGVGVVRLTTARRDLCDGPADTAGFDSLTMMQCICMV